MVNNILLNLKNISKSYEVGNSKIEVLNDLSFELPRGTSIAVTGSSGIGKSTLLNIIGTIDRPDSGTYHFAQRDVLSFNDENIASFRNKNIGFVFQAMYLLQEFTALENVIIPALIAKVRMKEAEERAMNLLKDFELENRRDHKPSQLSGGERQRVAIARAIVNRPMLLLADEPTGNLDERNSEIVINILSELNKDHDLSLILVTHNIHLAKKMDVVYSLEKQHLKRVQ